MHWTRRQVAACASSRYEFEVFSGSVASVTSEALVSAQSTLLALARAANLWRKPPLAAAHQMVVRAPDGRARTFSFGTDTADVLAQASPRACYREVPRILMVQGVQGLLHSAPLFSICCGGVEVGVTSGLICP